eukprot:PhF_6_TR34733/c0_g1_i1/m.50540
MTTQVLCRLGSQCKRIDCPFFHPDGRSIHTGRTIPTKCGNNSHCQERDCFYLHPDGRRIDNEHYCPTPGGLGYVDDMLADLKPITPPRRDTYDPDSPTNSPGHNSGEEACYVIYSTAFPQQGDIGFQISFDAATNTLKVVVSVANAVKCISEGLAKLSVIEVEKLLAYGRKVLEDTDYHQSWQRCEVWPQFFTREAAIRGGNGNHVVSVTVKYHSNDDGTYSQMGPATFAEHAQTYVVTLSQNFVNRCVVVGVDNQCEDEEEEEEEAVSKLRRAFHFAQWYVGGSASSTLGPSPVEQRHTIYPKGTKFEYEFSQTPGRVISTAMMRLFNANSESLVVRLGRGPSLVQIILTHSKESTDVALLERCQSFARSFQTSQGEVVGASFESLSGFCQWHTNGVVEVGDLMDATSEYAAPLTKSFGDLTSVPYGSVFPCLTSTPCQFTSPLRSYQSFYHQEILLSLIRGESRRSEFGRILDRVTGSVELLCRDINHHHQHVLPTIAAAEAKFVMRSLLATPTNAFFNQDSYLKNFVMLWTAMVITTSPNPSVATVSLLNHKSYVHTEEFQNRYVRTNIITVRHNTPKQDPHAPVIFEDVPIHPLENLSTPLPPGSIVHVCLDI